MNQQVDLDDGRADRAAAEKLRGAAHILGCHLKND
jgi:hypothetical protein